MRLLPPTGAEAAQTAESAFARPNLATKPSSPALSGRKAKAGRAAKPTEPPRFRSLDMTGNVRMLTDQDIADLAADALERGATGKSRPAAAPRSAAVAWSAASPSVELPIAGYDELTLPSLRARLRQFNVDQLEILLSYERSHAGRDDVVTMFERRISKLGE